MLALHTELSRDELQDFLLHRWEPSPVVSPWNGGSGFFTGDNVEAFATIEGSDDPRLTPFRTAIAASRTALERAGLDAKPSTAVKPELLRDLRATLPDEALEWLDAAIVLMGQATGYPPLLGSGGNDGRYDVANNHAQALVVALAVGGDEEATRDAGATLASALWGGPAPLRKMSLAHFFRDASPVNSPSGESDALGNPWQLVLAVEGTMVLAAGAGRRLADRAADHAALVAPFTVSSTPAGYGSAVAGEKGRAELWLPLWRRPAALAEVETLFREARLRVAGRAALTGLDAARAAGELGVARGLDAFQRFSILERAGQANLSVPAGRIEVAERPAARALGTIDEWLRRTLVHAIQDVPGAQREAIARLRDAAYAVAERGGADAVQALLVALGHVETTFARSGDRTRPAALDPPRPRADHWLEALGAGSVERRVAIALASVSDDPTERESLPALRDYLHGTALDDRGIRRCGMASRHQVPTLASPVDRLAVVHERRHVDAGRARRTDESEHDGAPRTAVRLGFDSGIALDLSDLDRFVAGPVDEHEVAELVGGLSLLDYRGYHRARPASEPAAQPLTALLALAFHEPSAPDRPPEYRCRPRRGWVSRLRARQVAAVTGEALLRLRLSGLEPIPEVDDLRIRPELGPRLAAGLLAITHPSDLARVRKRLTIPQQEDA